MIGTISILFYDRLKCNSIKFRNPFCGCNFDILCNSEKFHQFFLFSTNCKLKIFFTLYRTLLVKISSHSEEEIVVRLHYIIIISAAIYNDLHRKSPYLLRFNCKSRCSISRNAFVQSTVHFNSGQDERARRNNSGPCNPGTFL